MIKHIVWWALALGLVVGVLGIFCMDPMKVPIMKYPTPETVDKLVYKDKNGICYKYVTKEVNCDANESRLKSFPLS